ncbi:hypothetical protein Q0Z83_029280 [Actinoplanes sichuanensis]|uniref:Uncharacterized protein n=1 Tax=Actinoplanes sichuanensis TaxID=512349 RepID=A0ABW4AW23_9ACTN|nr:hypothetical protein [Actinoplanes sichuanensis]BEL04737.1 hypothetical protein Q0Z83_029280 [Actinoplanes sichuanensis]
MTTTNRQVDGRSDERWGVLSPADRFRVTPITYPTLWQSMVSSFVILGRTLLITLIGFALLIGVTMVIAIALTSALGMVGFDPSTSY